MTNINVRGRWTAGQKNQGKHVRGAGEAPPVKRTRPGRDAYKLPDENGFKLGLEVTQPGDAGAGVIVDIRDAAEHEQPYGVRSPGGKITYYAAAELNA